jgi:hypothetical protein
MEEGTRYGRNTLYVASASAAVRGSYQTVMDGKGNGHRPIVTGRLVEDTGEMIRHCFLTEPQCLGDLPIALTLGDQLEHCSLALGQVGRQR